MERVASLSVLSTVIMANAWNRMFANAIQDTVVLLAPNVSILSVPSSRIALDFNIEYQLFLEFTKLIKVKLS